MKNFLNNDLFCITQNKWQQEIGLLIVFYNSVTMATKFARDNLFFEDFEYFTVDVLVCVTEICAWTFQYCNEWFCLHK